LGDRGRDVRAQSVAIELRGFADVSDRNGNVVEPSDHDLSPRGE
jgi:hypothetical protein